MMSQVVRTRVLQARSIVCCRSLSSKNFVIPFRSSVMPHVDKISHIPLNGLPFLELFKSSVAPASQFNQLNADLFIATARASDQTEKKLASLPQQFEHERLKYIIEKFEFTGAEAQVAHAAAATGEQRIADFGIVGLGKNEACGTSILNGYVKTHDGPISPYAAQLCGKAIAGLIKSSKAKTVSIGISVKDICPIGLQRLAEFIFLNINEDQRFKSVKQEKNASVFNALSILLDDYNNADAYIKALEAARETAAGIQLTRELVQAPPNICNTESLAAAASNLAKDFDMECKILGEKECKVKKMGAYLAVHQGSIYEPQFIHITYNPKDKNDSKDKGIPKDVEGENQGKRKKIVLIGKGLCTDTGGYNLKVGCHIEQMKCDMGGAGAVLGAARIIGAVKPSNVEVHFIVAAAENMISSKAFRPGDIITAGNGKTIEVGNTDAEGRLTLCDALVYAEREINPDYILDCATLTGAIVVGLGDIIGGLYSTDSEFMNTVLESAKITGTPIWPMPLVRQYRKLIDSNIADLNNTASSRMGGSITAALFLKEFIKSPWCHLDLAGPAFDSNKKEASGYGATLLADLVFNLNKKNF